MYIVTEWGAADLFDKPAEERAYELINIAHPDFRRELFEQAADCGIIRRNAADFGRIRAD
jgi:acyl-CoA hydrolase